MGVGGEDTEAAANPESTHLARDLIMVALAIFSIAILIYDEVAEPTGSTRELLLFVDWVVVSVFVVEFAYRWWQAPEKRRFLRKNWFEIPGMVPMAVGEASFLRLFRLVRIGVVFRLFRVVAVLSRLRRVNRVAGSFLRRSHLLTTLGVTATLLIAGAYAGWLFERHEPNTQFTSYFEALWWALVTVTTVGYGDIVPRTLGGRIVSTTLMLTGIGLISVLAATFANVILRASPAGATEARSVDRRLGELARLRASGDLTEEEYAKAKGKVLDEPK